MIPGTALSFSMRGVPGGTVTMPDGSSVEVGAFRMGETEVTWDLYDVFVYNLDEKEGGEADAVTRPSKPYIAMDRGFGHAGYPAISMSAKGAASFCEWLSAKTGKTYRLPTEAEWRHACALSGIDPDAPGDAAWHKDNADGTTRAVADCPPDDLGLRGMYGNASEWCEQADGTFVTIGGTYLDAMSAMGCTTTVPADAAWNESDPQFPKSEWWFADAGWVGFRLVCEIDEDSDGGE